MQNSYANLQHFSPIYQKQKKKIQTINTFNLRVLTQFEQMAHRM
jgi:hypothetical protein